MSSFIQHIGVLDKNGMRHVVSLTTGLNVITGRSSTGKSALIEIVDFCLGSSEFTVPQGVITSQASLYFLVLRFDKFALILARRADAKSAFLREESAVQRVENLEILSPEYFESRYFLPDADFRKQLGRYFGLILTDVDLDSSGEYRGSKAPLPSIRSFTSFMLQHQNLIANKHAIFYRFDEKEKREQTIEHMKVFLGLADQEYFLASQDLALLKAELNKVELQLPKKAEEKKLAAVNLTEALQEYRVISGTNLVSASVEEVVENPAKWHDLVATTSVRIDALADEFEMQRRELDEDRSASLAKVRHLERQLAAARTSREYADLYSATASGIRSPQSAEVSVSECPFCHSESSSLESEANRLAHAIQWLNGELSHSPSLRDSFAADERRIQRDLELARDNLSKIQGRIDWLELQVSTLERRRPVGELAIKAKLKVEAILEGMQSKSLADLEAKKENLLTKWRETKERLKRYDMDARLAKIQDSINLAMREIGANFPFEESFRPINLKFSLESFDLWHEDIQGKKIFLRSMGSGANWLYCHLTLFMALHQIFADLSGKGGKIPPILFLDQPSQVYFPSFVTDNSVSFDAQALSTMSGRSGSVDEDLAHVENVFDQLVQFCVKTKEATGIEPQIIVTDHADHLKLRFTEFENLVRARWRARGFIEYAAGDA